MYAWVLGCVVLATCRYVGVRVYAWVHGAVWWWWLWHRFMGADGKAYKMQVRVWMGVHVAVRAIVCVVVVMVVMGP